MPAHRPSLGHVVEAVDDVAGVVLVHVELAVEAEELRVGPQEALDVRPRRKHLEVLVLERTDVLGADLRRELDLWVLEPLTLTRLPETIADLEHSAPF